MIRPHLIKRTLLPFIPFLITLCLFTGCTFQPLQPAEAELSNAVADEQALGQLAYIGNDGNVYVTLLRADGKTLDTRQITDDATAPMEAAGRSYHRLAWSRDGRLAFAAMDRSTRRVDGQLFTVTSTINDESNTLTIGETNTAWRGDGSYVIYLYWSPNACPPGRYCNQLAFLDASPETMGLRLVNFSSAASQASASDQTSPSPAQSARILQTGRPFYFGWANSGDQLLWHINGSALLSSDAAIGLVAFDKNMAILRQETLALDPGSFLAPAWSPTADQWLAVALPENREAESGNPPGGELRLFEGARTSKVGESKAGTSKVGSSKVADAPINVQYVWSPDGRAVAYAHRKGVESGDFGPLHLYSIESGKTEVLTAPAWNIRGFFWSPDSQQIGFIHDLGAPDPRWMQWRTVSVETKVDAKVDRGFAAFRAGFGLRFMLGSFGQYAQSHRYWSPNGRYLLFVDEDMELVTRVWLVDTEAASTARPLLVAEGSLAVWAWANK